MRACLSSVSDRHKLLLLKTPDIFKPLVLGLFISPEHPRGNSQNCPKPDEPWSFDAKNPATDEIQAIYQSNYAETLHQLALFPSGREAMLQEAAVLKALEEVAERGMTAEAREHAEGALMALSDKEIHASGSDGPKHIMLSYQVRTYLRTALCFRLLVLAARSPWSVCLRSGTLSP